MPWPPTAYPRPIEIADGERVKVYPMRRVCGWCGDDMPGEPGIANRPGVVTHGICPKCAETVQAKTEGRNAEQD